MIGRPPVPAVVRFWRLVNGRSRVGGCWIWIGKRHRGGYGHFNNGKGGIYAHRFAYEQAHGSIPEGLTLDHLCRNTSCVNPAHLEAVTMRENILRGTGRAARNAQKTHCRHGHSLAGRNLIRKGNERVCRSCHQAAQRRYWRKKHGTPQTRYRKT